MANCVKALQERSQEFIESRWDPSATPTPLDLEQVKKPQAQLVAESASCITQADALLSQCSLLAGMKVTSNLPAHSPTTYVLEQHIDQRCRTITDLLSTKISNDLRTLCGAVQFDQLTEMVRFSRQECVASGSRVTLKWNTTTIPDTPLPAQYKTKVKIVKWKVTAKRDWTFPNNDEGKDICCTSNNSFIVEGLEGLQECVFELGVVCTIAGETVNVEGIDRIRVVIPPLLQELDIPGLHTNFPEIPFTITRGSSPCAKKHAFGYPINQSNTLWKLKIASITGDMFFFGISEIDSQNRDTPTLGWGNTNCIWCENVQQTTSTWQGWRIGDEGFFHLDTINNVLCMKHLPSGLTHSMKITPNKRWRLHICLCCASKVELGTATREEYFGIASAAHSRS